MHISKSNSFVVLKYVIDTLLEIEMRSGHNDWLRERERERELSCGKLLAAEDYK